MRAQATLILAQHLGQVLTQDLAARIVAQFPTGGKPLDLSALPRVKYNGLTFSAERAARILPELEPLHRLQWKETEGYLRGEALMPQVEDALMDEAQGAMVQLTARDEGQLIGHFRMYLRRSRHTGKLIAVEDTMYLMPEYRRGWNASKFIDYMEAVMRGLGVSRIFLDDKVANRAAGVLLDRKKYEIFANRRHKSLEA